MDNLYVKSQTNILQWRTDFEQSGDKIFTDDLSNEEIIKYELYNQFMILLIIYNIVGNYEISMIEKEIHDDRLRRYKLQIENVKTQTLSQFVESINSNHNNTEMSVLDILKKEFLDIKFFNRNVQNQKLLDNINLIFNNIQDYCVQKIDKIKQYQKYFEDINNQDYYQINNISNNINNQLGINKQYYQQQDIIQENLQDQSEQSTSKLYQNQNLQKNEQQDETTKKKQAIYNNNNQLQQQQLQQFQNQTTQKRKSNIDLPVIREVLQNYLEKIEGKQSQQNEEFKQVLLLIKQQFELLFSQDITNLHIDHNIEGVDHNINKTKQNNKDYYLIISFRQSINIEQFFVTTVIKIKKDRFSFINHFENANQEPIIIDNKTTRNLISRYFIRLTFRLGEFGIDPMTGQLQYKIVTAQNFLSMSKEDVQEKVMKKLIRVAFSTSYYAIDYYFVRIAYISGLISKKFYLQLEELQKVEQQYPPDKNKFFQFKQIVKESTDIMQNIHMYLYQMQDKKFDIEKSNLQSQIKLPKNQSMYTTTLAEVDEFIENKDKKPIKIGSGGFADVYEVHGNMVWNQGCTYDDSLNIYAMKKEKQPNETNTQNKENKVIQEINFLKQIKEKCPFITQYYQTKKEPNVLYMELSQYSLDRYCHYNKSLLSLNTKLFFITQIALTLRFLKLHNVYHLDLKPSNIMLGNSLFIRFVDFGESFKENYSLSEEEQKERKSKFLPAHTLPFTPPEILNKKNIYGGDYLTPACDIYSLGAIISEIIFEKRILDNKKICPDRLRKKLMKYQYKIQVCNYSIAKGGVKHVLQILKILMLLCCSPFPEQRPSVEWIIIILKDLINFLEKFY